MESATIDPHISACELSLTVKEKCWQQSPILFLNSSLRRFPEWARGQATDSVHFVNRIAWTMPEITFWSFSSWEIIFPFLLEHYHNINIPVPLKLDMSWNILDGLASIGIGITQLADTKTHRPWVNRIKGIINLCSGIQLLLLTALASPAVPLAFAAASIVDFVLSLEPLFHALKRYVSFNYWLEDSLVHFDKINEDILELKTEQLAFDESTKLDSTNEDVRWIAQKKQQRLNKLIDERDLLLNQIGMRIQAHVDDLEQTISKDTMMHLNKTLKHQEIVDQKSTITHETENKINDELFDECIEALQETLVFSLSAAGWILFCIPGMQLPAVVLITIVALCYLTKNAHALYTYFQPEKSSQDLQKTPINLSFSQALPVY